MGKVDEILAKHGVSRGGGTPEIPVDRLGMAAEGALAAFPGGASFQARNADTPERIAAASGDIGNLAALIATGGIGRAVGAGIVGMGAGAALGSQADKIGAFTKGVENKIAEKIGLDKFETNLPDKGVGGAINVLTRLPRPVMETAVEALPMGALMALGIRAKGSQLVKAPAAKQAAAIADLSARKFNAPLEISSNLEGEIKNAIGEQRGKLGQNVGKAKEDIVSTVSKEAPAMKINEADLSNKLSEAIKSNEVLAKKAPGFNPAVSSNKEAAKLVSGMLDDLSNAKNFNEISNVIDNFKGEVDRKVNFEGFDKKSPIIKETLKTVDSWYKDTAKSLGAGEAVTALTEANKPFSQFAVLNDLVSKSFVKGEFSPAKMEIEWKKMKGSKAASRLEKEQIDAIDNMIRPNQLGVKAGELKESIKSSAIPFKQNLPGFITKKTPAALYMPEQSYNISKLLAGQKVPVDTSSLSTLAGVAPMVSSYQNNSNLKKAMIDRLTQTAR